MELRAMLSVSEDEDDDIELTGHADVVGDRGELVHGLDWKSGRKPSDYYHQMAGYAFLLLCAFPAAKSTSLTLVWLRERVIETFTWTRQQAAAWAAETVERLKSELYCPDKVCQFCPRQTNCPALRAKMRAIMLDLTGQDHHLPELTAETWLAMQPSIATGWHNMKLVEGMFEKFNKFVRDGVEKFGSLSLGDKTELRLVPIAASKVLKTKEAWPVVTEMLTEDELAECIKIELKKVEEIVMSKAKRGTKGNVKEQLLEQLKQADAVFDKPNTARLNEVRKQQENP
jgi:hypothetical protein